MSKDVKDYIAETLASMNTGDMLEQFIHQTINDHYLLIYNNNQNQARFAVVTDEQDRWFGRVVMVKPVKVGYNDTFDAVLYNREASTPAKGSPAGNLKAEHIKLFPLRTEAVSWANRITKLIPVR